MYSLICLLIVLWRFGLNIIYFNLIVKKACSLFESLLSPLSGPTSTGVLWRNMVVTLVGL